jgi:hypothetical protein
MLVPPVAIGLIAIAGMLFAARPLHHVPPTPHPPVPGRGGEVRPGRSPQPEDDVRASAAPGQGDGASRGAAGARPDDGARARLDDDPSAQGNWISGPARPDLVRRADLARAAAGSGPAPRASWYDPVPSRPGAPAPASGGISRHRTDVRPARPARDPALAPVRVVPSGGVQGQSARTAAKPVAVFEMILLDRESQAP